MKKQQFLAQIAMIITTMIWGVTFVIVKDALNDAGPYMFAFLRFGFVETDLINSFLAAWANVVSDQSSKI